MLFIFAREVLREIFSRKSLSRAQEAAMTALLYGEVVEDWTAPLSELSAFYHCRYEAVDGVGSDWRLVQGMGCVVEAMGDVESVLQVKEEVRSVRELEEIVWLEPQQLNASVAVVAVPLGVLKTRGLAIEPLPAWKQRAWLELGLGNAVRAVLEFEEVFWHQKEFFMDVNWPSCGNQSFLDSVDLCRSMRNALNMLGSAFKGLFSEAPLSSPLALVLPYWWLKSMADWHRS